LSNHLTAKGRLGGPSRGWQMMRTRQCLCAPCPRRLTPFSSYRKNGETVSGSQVQRLPKRVVVWWPYSLFEGGGGTGLGDPVLSPITHTPPLRWLLNVLWCIRSRGCLGCFHEEERSCLRYVLPNRRVPRSKHMEEEWLRTHTAGPIPTLGLGRDLPTPQWLERRRSDPGREGGGVVVEGGPTLSVHFSLPSPAHPGDNQSLEITVFHLQQPLTLGSLLRRGAWAQVETYNEPFHNVPFR